MNYVPITPLGFKNICEKLAVLKESERPKIIESLKKARSFGDLKENSEYKAALDEQLFLERKIEFFEKKVKNSFVIDVTKFINKGQVIFGSTVVLEDQFCLKTIQYKIVGIEEADVSNRCISISSPIAKSLIGRFKSEIIHLHTTKGLIVFKIFDVFYI